MNKGITVATELCYNFSKTCGQSTECVTVVVWHLLNVLMHSLGKRWVTGRVEYCMFLRNWVMPLQDLFV